jgi:hypothetical protein
MVLSRFAVVLGLATASRNIRPMRDPARYQQRELCAEASASSPCAETEKGLDRRAFEET